MRTPCGDIVVSGGLDESKRAFVLFELRGEETKRGYVGVGEERNDS